MTDLHALIRRAIHRDLTTTHYERARMAAELERLVALEAEPVVGWVVAGDDWEDITGQGLPRAEDSTTG
jgi:hypothetical protein